MMFRFRLEKVLQHRRRQVQARSRDVATARAALTRAQQAHTAAARDLQESREAVGASRRAGRLDAVSLMRDGAWHDRREQDLAQLALAVREAEQRVAAAQERLTDAWRDREVLERLRERQERQWQQEQARRERRALDEIGSIRAALAGAAPTGGEA
jgi:flagellar FliJ protein